MQLAVFLFFIFIAFFIGKNAGSINPAKLIIFIFSLIVVFITFINPVKAVIILIFSMLFSPEIGVGKIPGREVVVRYDDILLVLIFLIWLLKSAVVKKEPFLIKTPFQLPLFLYTSVYVLSSFLGILRGDLIWQKVFFYVLKVIEYYLMYFMVVNILKDEKNFYKYLKYGVIVLIIVVIYSYYYYFNSSGEFVRTTAPFEAPLNKPQESEPASLGGYYLLCMGIILALISEVRGKKALFLMLLIVFIYPSFLLTFSRASYMGFIALFLTFLFFVKKKKPFFIITSFFIFSFSILLPGVGEKVRMRIKSTYEGGEARNLVVTPFGIVKLEDSAYARYRSIENVILNVLPNYPLLGKGVTGIGLGDNQYSLLLGETGITGFLLFLWLIYSILNISLKVYNKSEDIYERSIGLGVFCATIGFLVQSLGVNTFIIVRIMEPYWFSLALLSLSYLKINKYLLKS
ncbi:MAG: hypothetical protein K6357_08540 [Elusimicrobiota bacterium]